MLALSVGVLLAGSKAGRHLRAPTCGGRLYCPAGISAHPAPRGHNDTPRRSLYSPYPHTPCGTVHVYTSVCKLATVYTVTKPKGRSTQVLLVGGAGDASRNRQPYTPVFKISACTHTHAIKRTRGTLGFGVSWRGSSVCVVKTQVHARASTNGCNAHIPTRSVKRWDRGPLGCCGNPSSLAGNSRENINISVLP